MQPSYFRQVDTTEIAGTANSGHMRRVTGSKPKAVAGASQEHTESFSRKTQRKLRNTQTPL